MSKILFCLTLILITFSTPAVRAHSVIVDGSFRTHGVPGIEITDTKQVGYELVYAYKLLNIDGKVALCGAIITNKWHRYLRKAVGVTVASLSGTRLKRGLNYLPNYEANSNPGAPSGIPFYLERYLWTKDIGIATGRTAKCKRMRPMWQDGFANVAVTFELPKTVYVRR